MTVVMKNQVDTIMTVDLGIAAYVRVFDLQQQIVAAKIKDPELPDIVLVLEHPPVFTLGKRGGKDNLVVSEPWLSSRGIEIVQTQRGGNITYHGPGQLVMYPILDLNRSRTGVADFVNTLEETMILACRQFKVPAIRNSLNHGIWVGSAKIGSIGLTIKKGISFHGMALNVAMDLEPFSWINPCGLRGVRMTSVARETGIAGSTLDSGLMSRIKQSILEHFAGLCQRSIAPESSLEFINRFTLSV
ncbi:MAG: lipoyl(octanoyl) transferase LipB [Pseudomonadota bacterium]